VQYDLPVIIVVADNGMYGTIRMHQERHYPGRVVATGLKESGFRRLCAIVRRLRRDGGEDCGFHGGLRGRAEIGQAAIIHLKIDPEALTPAMSLSAIREKAQAGG